MEQQQQQQQEKRRGDADIPPHSADPTEELPRVLLALRAVYTPGAVAVTPPSTSVGAAGADGTGMDDPLARRDVADRYLTSFQRTPAAWVVCDRLLSASDLDAAAPGPSGGGDGSPLSGEDSTLRTQRQFFAAQTLHAKCLSDVHQLPPSSLPSLRDSLLAHFVAHASDSLVRAPLEDRPVNRPLVTRLSMAIASLAAQMRWTSVLTDVADRVLKPHPELGPAVLELFRSVPEEADSGRLVLESDEDLWHYRDVLRSSAHVALGLCEHAVRSIHQNGGGGASFSDVATAEAVLSCLQSWIRIVDMDPRMLRDTMLLPWVFDLLQESTSGGFELAVDVVVELLRTYPSDRPGAEGLVGAIIPRVMALGRDGDEGRLGPFGRAVRDEDEDGTRGYCRVFTEMSESYLSLILSHEEMGQASLVELVLRCSSVPDREIAGITLHFWYRFVLGLEELEPFEFRQAKIDSFAPQLSRLLEICTRLLRYPDGVEDLTPDRLDDVEAARSYFADTIEDCCRLLGGEAVLRAAGEPLQEECKRVASLPPDRQLAEWHGMEAHLYAIQAVSLYVPPDENSVVPFVMGLVPQLPGGAQLLCATACQTVGRYASWLGRQPSYLQPLLPYLAQGLSIPRCASASASAIREVCERCDSLGDSVLQLYDGILEARRQHQAGGSGEDFILDVKNELAVLEGVCRAVSTKAAGDPSVINHLAHPIIGNLRAMASPQSSPSPKQLAAEVCRLTVLIQHLRLPRSSTTAGINRPDFILGIMREAWPMLDAVSTKHPRDFNCGEKLCRLHKHALRECGAGPYAPMLESLAEQTVRNFSLSLSSPYLYLASIIVSEYGGDPARSELLYNMVASLSSTVFSALRTADDLTNHPDVVEELFFMAGRMVNHCPSPLVRSPLLNSLLRCAALGMRLHHRDANRGTLNFLEATVSYSLRLRSVGAPDGEARADAEALERAVLAEGQPLVANLARALLGDLPACRLDSGSGSVSGVLFCLSRLCPDLLLQWIRPPLAAGGAPGRAGDVFLDTLRGAAGGGGRESSRDEFDSGVRRFAGVCERSRKRKI